ncbi:MAG: YkgJ family cysteine cluster protein [Candidatus Nitrosomaritimum aestuariumsis]
MNILILPRIGVSDEENSEVIKILAYQMMGLEKNGNTCPFLDTNSGKKSPHGGYPCSIYEKRPLACQTYPLIESDPITLDQKCKFCKEHNSADENLNSEIESLLKIKTQMKTSDPFVWRYATGIGEEADTSEIQTGWILEK